VCEAFINSQRHEGWVCRRAVYDDGGVSGATIDRPALQQLLGDLTAGRVDTLVVYKIDRLTRSITDFAKIAEILDARGASFVSVTQQFNTTTSNGAPDPERLVVLCAVRARGRRRAHPRQDPRQGRRPHHRRCGTGIWPDRDITAFRPDVPAPRVSLPTQSARAGPDSRGNPRLLDLERRIPARDRFAPDLYGAFSVKRLFLGFPHSSLFGAG